MYEFDDSRRPLVVARMRGHVDAAEIAQLRADLDALVDRRESFAIVFDFVEIELPPRAEVMGLLSWAREMRGRFSRYYDNATPRIPCFTAYHMPSMVGNVLRFFLQMLPSNRSQHVICASYEEAVEACENALARFESEC
ncbi:hypothetical protein ENSA5_29780 [Enhygromyxa salina]|uniref:STAS/SEC14 domain-containing protein n=1 Tax=Enhygromyxa salina TaxID=215803 RepID=A0A2S9Y057_9BACT|nr:STAS/SEC14 domain-containing protein [Enhygromyxa salina]PRP98508.1 hypothetical protein ENSA5_29780 [Enhygromyxa salina]